MISGMQMTSQEKSRLEELDGVLRSNKMLTQISPIISRVQAQLARKTEALMTWEPIPLELFGGALPPQIRSSWVFVLRAGADTGAERHPNSHQRMMSIQGSGDMRTDHDGRWHSNFLIGDPATPLEQRWISIPPNVWHRPVVGFIDGDGQPEFLFYGQKKLALMQENFVTTDPARKQALQKEIDVADKKAKELYEQRKQEAADANAKAS